MRSASPFSPQDGVEACKATVFCTANFQTVNDGDVGSLELNAKGTCIHNPSLNFLCKTGESESDVSTMPM